MSGYSFIELNIVMKIKKEKEERNGERFTYSGQSAANNPHYCLMQARFDASELGPGSDI
jgi:hypothetical protein